jgi:hypothetical protein
MYNFHSSTRVELHGAIYFILRAKHCSFLKNCKILTLTLTSSNYYMSPLSLSACFSTDVSRHVMYSLPNPSESEIPFSPLEELVLPALGRRGEGRGTERIPMLCARDSTPLDEEVTGSKRPDIIGPGELALGLWVRWGEGWGLGMKGRGVAYFLPQTYADIYHTCVFQKYVFCS